MSHDWTLNFKPDDKFSFEEATSAKNHQSTQINIADDKSNRPFIYLNIIILNN